jgi:hypothetical protein
MVNTADSRLRLDLARLSQRCLDDPIAGCALIQGYVGSVLVIIRQIFTSKPSKVVFVQRDDVIQELAASTAGPSFGDSILPRAPQTRSYRFDATRLQERENLSAELWSRSNSTKR